MGFSKQWMPLTVIESRLSPSLMRYSMCVSSLPAPLPLLYTPSASLTKLISEFSLVEQCAGIPAAIDWDRHPSWRQVAGGGGGGKNR